ncbi:ABC transporter ATP-binding protein [Amaricoccus sp.]|uniref:ABC transporter ATP-binding protein n=1 Tax=Amaricoccus sp. TaxID=1872485 RepID=UPI00260A54E6|nr:ABC transporter ATP-binding protein [Amaricoccus sp.]HRO10281.1 ABC transporter ATP-binding protein [Amaricoccus sp.]
MTFHLEMREIVKRFPGVLANDHVSLAVEHGEIHALLGENGAGKSTLMQILYGLYQRDSGEIRLDGAPVPLIDTTEAIGRGIGMIHQEFMLVRSLSVAENIVLGLDGGRLGGRLDLDGASARVRALSERHGLAIDPSALIEHLPIGVQQRVEILKLLYRDARLMILDEPTAVLTPQEKDGLFAVLRALAAEGRSVIIVTHKLHEIMDIASRVTVMRDGRVTACVETAATSERELARLMVGRDVELKAVRTPQRPGRAVLSVEGLTAHDGAGLLRLSNVSLDVHAGEILGVAGVDGNGQPELAQTLLGLRDAEQGAIRLDGTDISGLTTAERRGLGLAYIPADRRHVGSVPELSVADNASLGDQWRLARLGGLVRDDAAIHRHAAKLVRRFGVRAAGLDFPAGKLSGGNLQKLILAREIMREPMALVVEQPTRGLDVGAIETVWAELLAQRAAGKAILLISAELEEILNLADRIAVMFEGHIVGILPAGEASPETIGLMMAGRRPVEVG